ncbi:Uu.00g085080.m01.CDS01 [Anthostomella pinea]|uniref:Uu.00g085080.m01.CDS01 n=1 Tax=Anthostomella pinea TaxID=933095 RepID=A0AAI8YJT0_9PEZI|nr:Uu.00g085080.m01.CDS01 [Anthostomella pinea]
MGAGDEAESSTNTGSINLTRRSDLSPLYKVLRKVIRPLRPRLVSSDERCPAGSPRLEKHPRSVNKVDITERKIELLPNLSSDVNGDRKSGDLLWVYDFQPSNEIFSSGDGNRGIHTMYYFAGGGFQSPPSSEHWKLCAHLASTPASTGGRVVLVSYPLAPGSPAKDSLPLLRRWLAQALRDAEAQNGIVSLLGDSAGANVALSLGLWCADQLALAKVNTNTEAADSLSRLRSVMAISPPTDMRNQNPAVPLADATDPVLAKSVTDGAAEAWSKGSDKEDPYLSPNLADLKNVAAGGMRLNGVIGTSDVLAPDALVFLEKCKDEGVKGDWLVWEGQMHCFPLAACYGLRESKESRDWVEKTLGEIK